MDRIKKHWWKILSIVLMLYTLIVGMGTPLKPGILEVYPYNAQAGTQLRLKVKGYNSNYDQNETTAWLKIDSSYYIQSRFCASITYDVMTAVFDIPEYLPSKDSIVQVNLIVSNDEDKGSILPSAVFIKQNAIDSLKGLAPWSRSNTLEEVYTMEEFRFPYRNVIYETVRNTFYHVALWFAMFILLIISLVYNVGYLRSPSLELDTKAYAFTAVAILYGILGLITGSIWAKFAWGAFWTTDVKLNMTAVAMLIYFAYLVLRSSIPDLDRRAKLSAVYSIFAFFALIALVFIIPRMTDSLHPGNGGNPAFGGEDLDNTLRMVFYPSIIGFTLLGIWIASLKIRISNVADKLQSQE